MKTSRHTVNPVISPAAEMPDELLTIEEAAERIRMSARHLRRLIAERRIVHYRLGRAVRLAPGDLANYIADGRVEPITATIVWTDLRSAA